MKWKRLKLKMQREILQNNKGHVYLIENEPYLIHEIKAFLSNDLFLFLLENQYLVLKDDKISFQYVGVISVDTTIFLILPKYFALKNEIVKYESHFKKVLKVLKLNAYNDQIPDSKFLRDYEAITSEISLAEQLLKDYIEYGFYQRTKEETLLNADGEVNWDKTISSLDPVFSKRAPIYYNQFNYVNQTEDFNLIHEIHKWAVKYSLEKYGDILDFSFGIYEDVYSSLDLFGDIKHILYVLTQELKGVYIDREIRLLKNLYRLISNLSSKNSRSFNLFGTGYFHTVWELVCSQSFKNLKEQYKYLIPRPRWHNVLGKVIKKDTLDPDVIAYNEVDQSLFVLDAKYYNLKIGLNPFTVDENPGVGDISKQILYEKSFSSIPANKRYNILLFPSLIQDFIEMKGHITFELLENHKVYYCYLNPDSLFESYINSNHVGFENLGSLALQIDEYNREYQNNISTPTPDTPQSS